MKYLDFKSIKNQQKIVYTKKLMGGHILFFLNKFLLFLQAPLFHSFTQCPYNKPHPPKKQHPNKFSNKISTFSNKTCHKQNKTTIFEVRPANKTNTKPLFSENTIMSAISNAIYKQHRRNSNAFARKMQTHFDNT